MAIVLSRGPELLLPWSSSHKEDARFRLLAIVVTAVTVVLSLVVRLLPVPPPEMPTVLEQSQLARVILDKPNLAKPVELPKIVPPPKPVAVVPKPVEKPVPPPQAKPVKPVAVAPSKTKSAVRAGGGGGPNKEAPVELMQQAREVAAKSGVLAFKDDLAEMRESVDVSKVTKSNLTRGVGTAEKTERSVIAGKATGGSGGINTAALSRDTGGIALSGRETTRIEGPPGVYGQGTSGGGVGGGRGNGVGSGSGDGAGPGKNGKKGDLVGAGGDSGGRSDESIRRTMDQNKGAIFSIYNRALRENPDLKGRFVFEMVIDASGQVSDIKLISSELSDQGLIGKILARIRMISFGADDVQRTRVNYSLDFLPS
ncbi:MAG: AgmX/PglI C-terminal domain-containing protein [Spongiibacteraceae bacterium]